MTFDILGSDIIYKLSVILMSLSELTITFSIFNLSLVIKDFDKNSLSEVGNMSFTTIFFIIDNVSLWLKSPSSAIDKILIYKIYS